MIRVFVDTSAFLAIENKRDTHHAEAIDFRSNLLKQGHRLATSDYVLDESLTIIRKRTGHVVAVAFGEDLQASSLVQIVQIDPELFQDAWRIFKKFKEQEFSFTDCTSFAVMKALRIDRVFTFDSDFKTFGHFQMKP